MTTKLYRPPRDDTTTDGAEVLRGHAHDIAVNQLLPRIALRHQIAVETIQTRFHLYHRMRGARRCSCFDVEISPSSLCRCCYGTGDVGGYEKYGHNLAVLDVTHPAIQTVNVIPDYTLRTRPRRFILIPGARQGHIIARMPLQTTTGALDNVYVLAKTPPGTSVCALIRAPSDTTFVRFTREALVQRLFNPWIEVRINFERTSPLTASPRFGLLYLRYQRFPADVLLANRPRREQSSLLAQFGLADEWNEQTFWLDNTAKYIGEQDLLFDVDNNMRWKIIKTSPLDPQGLLLSWDLNARLIWNYEPENRLPL